MAPVAGWLVQFRQIQATLGTAAVDGVAEQRQSKTKHRRGLVIPKAETGDWELKGTEAMKNGQAGKQAGLGGGAEERGGRDRESQDFQEADLHRDGTQRNGLQNRTGQIRPELDQTSESVLVSRRAKLTEDKTTSEPWGSEKSRSVDEPRQTGNG